MTRKEYEDRCSALMDEYGAGSEEVVSFQWRETKVLRVLFWMLQRAAEESLSGVQEFCEEDFVKEFGEDVKDILGDVEDQIDEVLGAYLLEYEVIDGSLSLNFCGVYIPGWT